MVYLKVLITTNNYSTFGLNIFKCILIIIQRFKSEIVIYLFLICIIHFRSQSRLRSKFHEQSVKKSLRKNAKIFRFSYQEKPARIFPKQSVLKTLLMYPEKSQKKSVPLFQKRYAIKSPCKLSNMYQKQSPKKCAQVRNLRDILLTVMRLHIIPLQVILMAEAIIQGA